MYYPTRWDWAIFLGTIGFFLACMFLFLRIPAHDLDFRNARAGAMRLRRRSKSDETDLSTA